MVTILLIFFVLTFLEFKECFNLYDRDNDGIISLEEMKLIMRSLSQSPSEREIKEIGIALGNEGCFSCLPV